MVMDDGNEAGCCLCIAGWRRVQELGFGMAGCCIHRDFLLVFLIPQDSYNDTYPRTVAPVPIFLQSTPQVKYYGEVWYSTPSLVTCQAISLVTSDWCMLVSFMQVAGIIVDAQL